MRTARPSASAARRRNRQPRHLPACRWHRPRVVYKAAGHGGSGDVRADKRDETGRRIAGARSRSSRCRPIPTRRRSPPSRRSLPTYPPLVFAGEARKLKHALAEVAAGKAFLLQGGDCAESFAEHGADNIRDFFRVFLQMAVVLTFAGAVPVVKVGRIAGQFAKPRSSPTEKQRRRRAAELSRRHRQRHRVHAGGAHPRSASGSCEAYRQSAATLNLLRAFATGGYANLENAHHWMLGFVKDSPQSNRYQELANRITEALDFMRACGIDPGVASGDAHDRFLHQPRGAAARLRAGDDARRFDHRRLVRHLRPHALGRRPHAPARPRPRRVLPRHQEPDRPEVRAVAGSPTS